MRQRTRLFWTLQICGWGLYGIAMFLALLPYMKWRAVFAYRGTFTALCFLASLVLHLICRALWRAQRRFPLIAATVLSFCSIAGYFTSMAAILAEMKFSTMPEMGPEPSLWLGSIGGGINAAMVLVAWAALYFGFKHYEQIEDERRRVLQMEASARDAQLRALRYQVQPHFLFNTLNAISTLVVEGNAHSATAMISRLADFFRATLDADEHQATLEEEIHLVEQYLAIEKIRLGERLTVEIDVARDALDVLVPRLLLQPLAENSIRHSIAPKPEGGRIRIFIRREHDRVRITLSDTGNGIRPPRAGEAFRGGVGLANTEKRLRQTYGDDYLFHVQSSNLGGWEILIDLPAQPAALTAGVQP
ncbi:MAG: sensor histidine kinase [Terriglobales bacterium]